MPQTGTLYSEVTDFFLLLIRDYEIDEIYDSSLDDFETFLNGILKLAIPDFDYCNQDLGLRNETDKTFLITLTDKEKSILARLMVLVWLERKIQDVTQLQLHLNDTDFRHYSEAQNLKEKQSYYLQKKEQVEIDIGRYGYQNADWSSWANGVFL